MSYFAKIKKITANTKIWVRLGGYITLEDTDLEDALLDQGTDGNVKDKIVLESLKQYGFEVDGETVAENEAFEVNLDNLHLRA